MVIKFFKENYFSKPIFVSTLICIFIFYSGMFDIKNKHPYYSIFHQSNVAEISGFLISTPSKSSNGKTYSAKLDIKEVTTSENFKASAKGIITVLIPSEMVEAYFPGKLYSSANNGAFLYEAGGYYNFKGKILKDFFKVEQCTEVKWGTNFTSKLDYFRALCRLQFKRLMYSWNEPGGLLLALLSGAREYTNDETKEAFKNAGLSHILALSGMHLSMFSSIATFFGKKLKNKKLTYIFKILILILFVWFAGFSPSLLRAFIFSNLMLLSCMFSTSKPNMVLILCFTFHIQIILSPSDITNTGFLLSYSALAGILLFNSIFSSIYDFFLPKTISSSLSASSSAQIFTIPISLKFFNSFSPIGIIATSIVSPLITIFIYTGLLLIVLSLIFPFIQGYSGIFVNFLYTIIKNMVVFFSKAPRILI